MLDLQENSRRMDKTLNVLKKNSIWFYEHSNALNVYRGKLILNKIILYADHK